MIFIPLGSERLIFILEKNKKEKCNEISIIISIMIIKYINVIIKTCTLENNLFEDINI